MIECSTDGCNNQKRVRGMCTTCYARWARHAKRDGTFVHKYNLAPRLCYVLSCNRPAVAKELCGTHWSRDNKGLPLDIPIGDRAAFYEKRICSVDGCARKHAAVGYCQAHWLRARKGQRVDTPIGRKYIEKTRRCGVDECGRKHAAHGYCHMHLERVNKGNPVGQPFPVSSAAPVGSKRIDTEGYVSVRPPFKRGETDTLKTRWIREHRLVMEHHLGRALHPHEEVHHKNGVRHDNQIENLELWTTSHPAGQRASDKLAWAKEIVALYDGADI